MTARINKITLLIVSAAGASAGIVGFFADVAWIRENAMSFLLAELSALFGLALVEFSRIRQAFDRLNAPGEKVTVLPNKEAVYRVAISVLRDSRLDTANRSLWMLSGTGGPKERIIKTQLDPIELEYDRELVATILRTGWSTRVIFNVDDVERLDWVYGFLTSLEGADELEARTFVRRTGSMLAPLIVGRNNVLIADGDRRYYRRVRSGVHLAGHDVNEFIRGYFDLLWQSPELRVLRTPVGLANKSFDDIRAELAVGA